MAYDEGLAERMRDHLDARPGLTEKKMFGGVCFLINGNMCAGIVRDELMLRVGADGYEDALAQPHSREMDFTGRAMKGMIYVACEGFAEDDDLAGWLDRAIGFAGSLPPKMPKPKKAAAKKKAFSLKGKGDVNRSLGKRKAVAKKKAAKKTAKKALKKAAAKQKPKSVAKRKKKAAAKRRPASKK